MNVVVERMILLICLLVNFTNSARILGIFPIPAKSHMIINSAYMQSLAERGHHVTVFSPLPEGKPIPNYEEIMFDVSYAYLFQGSSTENMYDSRNLWYYEKPLMWWNVGNRVCEILFQDEYIQRLMHSTERQFDLLVIAAFFNDCALSLAHKLNVPIIKICPFAGTIWMDEWVGNPTTFSYVPDIFQDLTNRMTFWERMKNMLGHLYVTAGRRFYSIPSQDVIVKKYLNQSEDFPSIYELQKKISLVLVNSDISTSYPRPIMPNFIEIGGIHLKPSKKLPEDLQKFMNESMYGLIYFSMGSNLKSSKMPKNKIQAFLKAFSTLKQRVIWKWETNLLPGQPNNVRLGKWFPQSDILAHPNVKLFITHGGLLSTQETISRGVPAVGIPIYADQSMNVAHMVSAGFGVKLDFENISSDSILWAVNEVIENPRYSMNAKKISKIHNDQPRTPVEKAVYWTEYVIRHNGTQHMRSAALDLTWYQYFLLDVFAVFAIIVLVNLLVLILVIQFLYKKYFEYSKVKQKVIPKQKVN